MTGIPESPPKLDIMIEDWLAIGGSEEQHAFLLRLWVLRGAEYMARSFGRQFTLDSLDNVIRSIRDIDPATPWKP